jgi:ribosome-associated heat shock protein Hsp15
MIAAGGRSLNTRRESQRLDTWLDVACLFKTRTAAARACDGGKVEVNGGRAKPHRAVRVGDLVHIGFDRGRRKIVRIAELEERSVSRAAARALYEDLTPPPSAEQIAIRERERLSRPSHASRPDARDRRALRRLKGLETDR